MDTVGCCLLYLTSDSNLYLASSWVLGHLVSGLFAGFLNDAIGRKKSLLIDTVVFFVGFLLLAVGNSTAILIVGRILLGYPLVSQASHFKWHVR